MTTYLPPTPSDGFSKSEIPLGHESRRTVPKAFLKRYVDDLLAILGFVLFIATFLFLFLPLCVTALMAFDSRTYLGPLPPPSLSLQWFQNFFSDPNFIRGLKTSLTLASVVVTISAGIGIAVAVVLHRRDIPGKNALSTFFVSPLMVPPVVIGFALLLFLAQVGILEGFVRLLCGHVILTVPYTIRATLAGLAGINPMLREAAIVLGANERQAFWSVTFPLARTGIIAGAIFAFAVSMDDVAVSMFLTDATTYTLPVALVSSMRASFNLTIAAASILLIGFTIVLIVALDLLVGSDKVVGEARRQ